MNLSKCTFIHRYLCHNLCEFITGTCIFCATGTILIIFCFRHLLQEAKLELKKSKRKDYYKILGVERNANDEEIKKAYRKRAMVHHPDRHSGATDQEKKDHEQKFKEVTIIGMRGVFPTTQVGSRIKSDPNA